MEHLVRENPPGRRGGFSETVAEERAQAKKGPVRREPDRAAEETERTYSIVSGTGREAGAS